MTGITRQISQEFLQFVIFDEIKKLGRQAILKFKNGYGASILISPLSKGLELAPLKFEDNTMTYSITNEILRCDVKVFLSYKTVNKLLEKIMNIETEDYKLCC